MESFEVNKLLGALLGTVFIVFSIALVSDGIFASPEPAKPGFEIVAQEPAAGGETSGGEQATPEPIVARQTVGRSDRGMTGVIGLSGALVCALGIIEFNRAKTTVNPTRPESASSLVRTGIYRRTRNPMYLGRAVQLLGWAAFLANPLAFLLVPLYLVYVNRFQVVAEESALLARFGPEYAAYQGEVPRWL